LSAPTAQSAATSAAMQSSELTSLMRFSSLLNAKYPFAVAREIVLEHGAVERQLARVFDRLYDRPQRVGGTVDDLLAQRGIGGFHVRAAAGRENVHVGRHENVR